MKNSLSKTDSHSLNDEIKLIKSRLDQLLEGKDFLEVRQANNADLSKISEYVAEGVSLSAQDIVVAPIAVCDNLLSRSNSKWKLEDLQKMVDLLPGTPTTLDHAYHQNDKVWGRVFDSEYISVSPEAVRSDFDKYKKVCDRAGNYSVNESIILQEGYVSVIAYAYTLQSKSIAEDILYGIKSEVSLGGFRVTDYECPLCNTSFRDNRCPHYIPDWLPPVDVRKELVKRNPAYKDYFEDYAPYYMRAGLYDLMELSFVTTPNFPNAKTIN